MSQGAIKVEPIKKLKEDQPSYHGHQKFGNGSEDSSETKHEPRSPLSKILYQLREDIVPTHGPSESVPPVSSSPEMGRPFEPTSGLKEIYVQNPSGKFRLATKEIAFAMDLSKSIQLEDSSREYETALDIAILVQKIWSNMSKICFGFLGGVSLFHLVLVNKLLTWDPEGMIRFVEAYSLIASILPTCFYVFLVMCLISLFDWFDLADSDARTLGGFMNYRYKGLLIVLYITIFLINLVTVPMDEKFIFYPSNPDIVTGHVNVLKQSTTITVQDCKQIWKDSWKSSNKNVTTVEDCGIPGIEELESALSVWKTLNWFRCALALIGWLAITMTETEDLLAFHLASLKKYDQPSLVKSANSLS